MALWDSRVVRLTQVQHAVIVGTLLGDGAMRCKKNALLEINHGAAQRAYVDWKFDVLRDLVRTPPAMRRTNGNRSAYRFTTVSLPELTPYYRAFYGGNRKSVPDLVLSPLSLAVCFMDDGCKSYRSVYFNTQQFDLESQQRLLAMLRCQFDIAGALNRDKAYSRIRVTVESTARLAGIIAPYVLPELKYKLP